MIILTIRTDKPEAELGLWEDGKKISYVTWRAHRQLAATLNGLIKKILNKSSISYEQLQGIVIFKGPGSFTGLRIGMAIANTLAYSLKIPVASAGGEDWIEKGIKKLDSGVTEKITLPEYGGAAKTTLPR